MSKRHQGIAPSSSSTTTVDDVDSVGQTTPEPPSSTEHGSSAALVGDLPQHSVQTSTGSTQPEELEASTASRAKELSPSESEQHQDPDHSDDRPAAATDTSTKPTSTLDKPTDALNKVTDSSSDDIESTLLCVICQEILYKCVRSVSHCSVLSLITVSHWSGNTLQMSNVSGLCHTGQF